MKKTKNLIVKMLWLKKLFEMKLKLRYKSLLAKILINTSIKVVK